MLIVSTSCPCVAWSKKDERDEPPKIRRIIFRTDAGMWIECIGAMVQMITWGQIQCVAVETSACLSQMNHLLQYLLRHKNKIASTLKQMTVDSWIPNGCIIPAQWWWCIFLTSHSVNLHGREKLVYKAHLFATSATIHTPFPLETTGRLSEPNVSSCHDVVTSDIQNVREEYM